MSATIGGITVPARGSSTPAGTQHEGRERDGAALTDDPVDPWCGQGAEQAADRADAHRQAEVARVQVEVVEHEQDHHRPGHRGEEVAGAGARRDPPQQRVADHEREPLADLDDERTPVLAWWWGVQVLDPAHEQRRAQEAQRVQGDREGSADHLDQATCHGRASDHRDRLRGLQLGVALADVLRLDDVRQVALVGHVEEDRAHAHDQRDGEQLHQRQDVEDPGERQRGQRHGPDQVVAHQHTLLAPAVHPGAGRQPDDQERQELAGPEESHLELVRVQQGHGQHRQRKHGELGADLADRVADEELPEVVVAQQPAALPGRRCLEAHEGILAH